MGLLLRVWEFLCRVCSSAERPLHFIKVQFTVPESAPNTPYLSLEELRISHQLCAREACQAQAEEAFHV